MKCCCSEVKKTKLNLLILLKLHFVRDAAFFIKKTKKEMAFKRGAASCFIAISVMQ